MQERRPNRDYYDEFAAGYEARRHHGYHAMIDRLEIAAAESQERRDAKSVTKGPGRMIR